MLHLSYSQANYVIEHIGISSRLQDKPDYL